MPERDVDLMAILDRYLGLGRADRKAILAGLSTAEKAALEAIIVGRKRLLDNEDLQRQQAESQFQGYSPWLATIVEAAVKGHGSKLAKKAEQELVTIHETIFAAHEEPRQQFWPRTIRLVADLLSPKGRTRA